MKNGSAKFLVGLLVGAAAGAAAAYLSQADKREKLMDDMKEIADKVKDSFDTYKSAIDERITQMKESAVAGLNEVRNSVSDALEVED